MRRRPGLPVHDDLGRRDFTADAPDGTWLTDITEHPTAEGKLYLCAIKDVYSHRIVGYSIGPHRTADLAVTALRHAIARRSPKGTVVHSDRGSQFRSRAFVRELKTGGRRGSMGRVGACRDNAAMESFFALLQKNVFTRRRWNTRTELRLAIVTWIERTYHRRRRQRTLGRLTPIEFETIYPATLTPRSTRVSTKAWALPIGRSLAYELVRASRWPTPVVHAGRFIRIPTRPLLDLLGVGEEVA